MPRSLARGFPQKFLVQIEMTFEIDLADLGQASAACALLCSSTSTIQLAVACSFSLVFMPCIVDQGYAEMKNFEVVAWIWLAAALTVVFFGLNQGGSAAPNALCRRILNRNVINRDIYKFGPSRVTTLIAYGTK
ncbi:hypothetical protein CPB84DRAFT_1750161 [Gymnopilus junonius]|uniref:Uncharacterized protein n=1 Tax=Gymnopilus junonius TaxID=109634 RepID=A0A9P5NHJ2_GYMJU|nr:hypothetical protein CPB84DRAFT_1750161 [Gymnopilus junonius]